ncbi:MULTISPECIES: toxin-antitoxin system HicB family antitoxin [unclassified Methylobacterium]|uniref:toxin-antitoxin system HicB family antitoxin n=1 Tax=unclassified Methylobacterium TaxID=2615210 RepID=UPI0031456B17
MRVETCARFGKALQRPYSGRLQFRVSPELHANVVRAAELSGKSLKRWGEEVLRRAAEQAAA